MHNYWCNLLSDTAINGQKNRAKSLALPGLIELCASLLIFWFQYSSIDTIKKEYKLIISISGSMAMLTGCFTFVEDYHNLVVNLAGAFGLVASLAILGTLYNAKQIKLFVLGMVNIFLIVCNAFLFFNKSFIQYLPVVQKITFITYLLWTCFISLTLFRRENKIAEKSAP